MFQAIDAVVIIKEIMHRPTDSPTLTAAVLPEDGSKITRGGWWCDIPMSRTIRDTPDHQYIKDALPQHN